MFHKRVQLFGNSCKLLEHVDTCHLDRCSFPEMPFFKFSVLSVCLSINDAPNALWLHASLGLPHSVVISETEHTLFFYRYDTIVHMA